MRSSRPWRQRTAFLALYGALLASPAFGAPDAPAATWEADFAAIAVETDRATTLSREELQRLVAECDRLRPIIEALPETPRKVYRRRLEMTRNLYLFALEAMDKSAELPAEGFR